ncbi:MAG: TatD family deoxyribonuclease [Bacillati bacterium ANGP1]|uniref:TatD family deoxyribonuclease n=1 Tax=Candidatus Segetimicrobium genomatis TaxID=2569760 RepID=A0A537LBH1_9BACT|nr:MAG: TatD family deoxyribonuclease [Terrabacteria group bacterium ANGP1]
MELFDSHVHLDDEAFAADLDAVIDRARQAGVIGMVTVGSDVASSRAAVALAERFPMVYAAVAIHPHEAGDATPEAMRELQELAAHPKVAAVGETGLDFAKHDASREAQRRAFVEHIGLSRELGFPLIIHCREAFAEVLEILERQQATRVIMHAFSGSVEIAARCVARGYYVSLAGPVTFRNARTVAQVAQEIPLEMLLVETDAPVLTPEPFRGRRNEPAHLRHIVQRIAELRGREPEEIAAATAANARRVYAVG